MCQGNNSWGLRVPEMECVNFIRTHLGMLEYDEDQRRLDRAEARREYEKVQARIEAERVAEAEGLEDEE
jgi:hypothetical protein